MIREMSIISRSFNCNQFWLSKVCTKLEKGQILTIGWISICSQPQRGFAHWPPDRGLCPWTPLGWGSVPDSRCGLALRAATDGDWTEVGGHLGRHVLTPCDSRRKIHREAEERNQFSSVCIFLMLDRNWWIFFTYINESISYNSVFLILACVKNFV